MELLLGDCLDRLKELKPNSIDAIVTDPPYGLSFMGKKWDYDVPSIEIWKECFRVLKPGGYLLAFAGTRTQHRMAVRIEDAGFEIRDMIAWVYGSGFPKSLDIGKAVDKLQGNEREVIGKTQSIQFREKGYEYKGDAKGSGFANEKYWGFGNDITKGTSEWEGWGTTLKPALEPITVARKPIEGTVAENCLKWGVGGINIDGCRIGVEKRVNRGMNSLGVMHDDNWKPKEVENIVIGRFPANIILDEEAGKLLDEQSGIGKSTNKPRNNKQSVYAESEGRKYGKYNDCASYGFSDTGGASRFFYCAKARINSVKTDNQLNML